MFKNIRSKFNLLLSINTVMAEIFAGCNFRKSADLRLFAFLFSQISIFRNLTPSRSIFQFLSYWLL